MNPRRLLANCSFSPYWWDDVAKTERAVLDLPATVDVAVIGAGYTGLHAALQTARGGRSTLVLDAEDAGWGCSTRNGGQVSTSLKPDLATLTARHGAERAQAILDEGQHALAWIGEFLQREGIDCGYQTVGRFHAAHHPTQYQRLAQSLARPQPKVNAFLVPQARQREELGSDAYFGGMVYPQHGSLHPARYHQGLLRSAEASGVALASRCAVTRIEPQWPGFRLHTARGSLLARDVVVATNGYTGAFAPWLRRRVIPIGSYMIATEPLPAGLMDELMPRNRVVSDSRKVVYYYRASPDRQRLLFGGRVSHDETDPRLSAPLLHTDMLKIFPALADVGISHSWMGFVAYSFDQLPHLGQQDSMHYAMGYCGSGISTASYFGMRIGQQVLGQESGRSPLSGLRFPSRPYYFGRPWFMNAALRYYRWRDRLGL